MNQYLVNGNYITLKDSHFSGTQSIDEYQQQILTALGKIGVTQNYITIDVLEVGVCVSWEINKQQFSFTCTSQETTTLNMGAIAQAIQEDVRQIKRGIKDLNLVMRQYSQEDITKQVKQKKGLLAFSQEDEHSLDEEDEEDLVFYSKADARLVINDIKSRYRNFTDLSLIPEKERNKLRKAYLYLGVEVKF